MMLRKAFQVDFFGPTSKMHVRCVFCMLFPKAFEREVLYVGSPNKLNMIEYNIYIGLIWAIHIYDFIKLI